MAKGNLETVRDILADCGRVPHTRYVVAVETANNPMLQDIIREAFAAGIEHERVAAKEAEGDE